MAARAALVVKAQQLERKLEIKDRRYNLKKYKSCFIGSECVSLILELKYAYNEQQAVDFGNQLIQNDIIQHVERHHTFKNQKLFYKFVDGYQSNANRSTSSIGSNSRGRLSLSRTEALSNSRNSRYLGSMSMSARHASAASNITYMGQISDLLARSNTGLGIGVQQQYIRRKDVYFRVNRYMRQNRLTDANNFLRDLLKYVSSNSRIDWSILEGPTKDNIDINHLTDATKEKELQDTMGLF